MEVHEVRDLGLGRVSGVHGTGVAHAVGDDGGRILQLLLPRLLHLGDDLVVLGHLLLQLRLVLGHDLSLQSLDVGATSAAATLTALATIAAADRGGDTGTAQEGEKTRVLLLQLTNDLVGRVLHLHDGVLDLNTRTGERTRQAAAVRDPDTTDGRLTVCHPAARVPGARVVCTFLHRSAYRSVPSVSS